jgi:DNA-binding CsgD family transcriptional regulator
VRLLAGGCTNRKIGLSLGITARTVETHRAAVMRKIGAHSIADVVRYAVRSRLKPGPE